MRRIFNEEKQSNTSIKSERKKISDALNESKGILESIKKEIRENEKELISQGKSIERKEEEKEGLQLNIADLADEMVVKDKELSDLNGKLKVKYDDFYALDEMFEKKSKDNMTRLMAMVNPKMEELNNMTLKLKDTIRLVELNTETKNKLDNQISKLEDIVGEKNSEIEDLNKELEAKLDIEMKMQDEIEKMNGEKTRLEEVKRIAIGTEQESVKTQKQIKEYRRELQEIGKEKAKRLEVATSLEKKLKVKEEDLAHRELSVVAKEKHVMGLAKVLQAHFDKHQMPIKVF